MGQTASHQHGTTATTTDGGHSSKTDVNRGTSAFRGALLSPLLYFLGSVVWVAGSACLIAGEPRDAFSVGNGRYNAANILFIIGSCFFIVATFVSLLASLAEAALLSVGSRVPGLARLLVLGSFSQLIGSILLLIGAALLLGSQDPSETGVASAGTILWLIGAFFWLIGMLLHTIIAMVMAAVTALMAEMTHRQRAWHGIAATFFNLIGWTLFTVGACAILVLRGPGFLLFGGLLWLVASSLWMLAAMTNMCGTYRFFVPILAFATAAAAVSGLVGGTSAQPGMSTAAAAGGATGASTGAAKADAMPTGAAAPVAPVGTNTAVLHTTEVTRHSGGVLDGGAAPAAVQVAV